jgi:dienelactone hydrolase
MGAVTLPAGGVALEGDLELPPGAGALVVFAHGSGSSRHSPRNRLVAEALRKAGLGTLLIDLLTAEEEAEDVRTRALRFDIELLAQRVTSAVDWTARRDELAGVALGAFGASTGAAAALVAAARRPERVAALVSRGGRPDLAGDALGLVRAPTLLIVGGADTPVIAMNRAAMARLRCAVELEMVPGASHLFEEPGALERVAELAAAWFARHLQRAA